MAGNTVHFNEHDRNQVLEKRRQIREIKRKRRRNAVLVLLLLIAIAAFLVSDYSKIQSIEISGNDVTDKEDILKKISVKKGETFFFLASKKDIKKEVEKVVFIKSATVSMPFPGKIDIAVKEDTPILYTYIQGDLYVVDQEGNVQKDEKQKWLSLVQRCPQASQFDLKSFKAFAKEYVKISSVVQNQISLIINEDSPTDPKKIKLSLDNGKIFYVRMADMEKHLTSKNYYLVIQKYPDSKTYDFLGNHVYVNNE